MSENCETLSFFQFMANLEQCRNRIPNAQSIKLAFSLTVTSYLTKTKGRTKKSLTQLSQKGIFSETTYVRVLT